MPRISFADTRSNKRVLATLRRRLALGADAPLDAVDLAQLHAAAVEELRNDSRRREQVR